ncbi:phage head morphogenesis protein [Lysinibacillus piscis]|uniref:Phage head morphogenesis domain-containing protein n=1 Tax=Lysinibacillus piscis TaxID=2518931 RepID=A0ABQ5NLW1_9BACI|nr:phage head morphogenesis protein [Lysinibacillus sp. KH24]GLC89341.1 hypothetical protein LYSBPC_24680 [Lysinibacillus sp. KH24]
MDQLRIFAEVQTILEQLEKTLEKKYFQLSNRLLKITEGYYGKYGETLSEFQRYKRLEHYKHAIDKEATTTYQQILADLQQAEEESFNKMYLLYAYLLYSWLQQNPANIIATGFTALGNVTETLMGGIVSFIKWLLSRQKLLFQAFKKEYADYTVQLFSRHKNDLTLNVYRDIRENLRTEAGQIETTKQIKKRTLNSKFYGIQRARDLFNLVLNFAQDKIYELAKERIDIQKMWVSMRDMQVRMQHRILDSQIADAAGYFHYGGDKAKRPKTWKDPGMNWGCRCKIFLLINGKVPKTSRIYDYQDDRYQAAVQAKIQEYQAKGKTYLQALKLAQSDIHPPKRKLKGYITFNEWLEKFGIQHDKASFLKNRQEINENIERNNPDLSSEFRDYVSTAAEQALDKVRIDFPQVDFENIIVDNGLFVEYDEEFTGVAAYFRRTLYINTSFGSIEDTENFITQSVNEGAFVKTDYSGMEQTVAHELGHAIEEQLIGIRNVEFQNDLRELVKDYKIREQLSAYAAEAYHLDDNHMELLSEAIALHYLGKSTVLSEKIVELMKKYVKR